MLKAACFTVNPFAENTWLVYAPSGDAVVFDPGFSNREEEKAFELFIENEQLKLVGMVNTHCHIDHILGNSFVARTWKLPLQTSQGEWGVYEQNRLWGQTYGLRMEPFAGDVSMLYPGEMLSIGEEELAILATPGHSPDHLSFYAADSSLLISGDVLFEGSIGRTDLPGGDFETLERSIRKVLYVLPDDTTVLCGHGNTTTIGREKVSNPFVRG